MSIYKKIGFFCALVACGFELQAFKDDFACNTSWEVIEDWEIRTHQSQKGPGFDVYYFYERGARCRPEVVSWGTEDEEGLDILEIPLLTRKELEELNFQDPDPSSVMMKRCRESAHIDSETDLDETEKILRLSHLSVLHEGDVLKPWEDAYKEGRFLDFNNAATWGPDNLFITRAIANPFIDCPEGEWVSDWEKNSENIKCGTLEGQYLRATSCASLQKVDNIQLFSCWEESPVGQILGIPPKNIVAASPYDMGTPRAWDLYSRWAEKYGDFYLAYIFDNGIHSPEELVQNTGRWNEIYHVPVNNDDGLSAISTQAYFGVTDEKNPDFWTGKLRDMYDTARKEGVPFVRFPKTQQKPDLFSWFFS